MMLCPRICGVQMRELRSAMRSDFRWLLGIMLGGFAGLLGVMTHGFYWL